MKSKLTTHNSIKVFLFCLLTLASITLLSAQAPTVFNATARIPLDYAFDAAGNCYTNSIYDNKITKYAPDGTGTVFYNGVQGRAICIDKNENLYAIINSSADIIKITQSGVKTTLASVTGGIRCMTIDTFGNLWGAGWDNKIYKITQAGVVSSFASGQTNISGITCDKAGNIYICCYQASSSIFKFTPAGVKTTHLSLSTSLWYNTIKFDDDDFLYIATANQLIFRYKGATLVSIFNVQSLANATYFIGVDKKRKIILGDMGDNGILKINADTSGCIPPSVTLNPAAATVCEGANYNLKAQANGTNLSYLWESNRSGPWTGFLIGGIMDSYSAFSSSIRFKSLFLSASSSFRCVISNACGSITTNPAYITVTNSNAIAITTNSSNKSICDGDTTSIAFATTGTVSNYKWQVSNDFGQTFTDLTNTATYSGVATNKLLLLQLNTSLNKNQYKCRMSNSSCVADVATATLTVNTNVTPSISIIANKNPVATGNNVIFTATPTNGGTTPVYQWKVNGINMGTNSKSYTTNTLADADKVTCVMTANNACQTTATATSNIINMTINPICVNDSSYSDVTICSNALPYIWNGNSYNAAGTYNVHFTIPGGCDSTAFLLLTVLSSSPTGINVSANTNNVCYGSLVTFTATPTNGGTAPIYQWKKNGLNVGSNNAIYTDATLNNNDSVWCVITSSSTCATPNVAISNKVKMIIKGNPSIGTSVGGTICNIGGVLTLNNSNTLNGGVWSSDNTSIVSVTTASNGASGYATGVSNGIANLTYTKTALNGCTSSASTTVIVASVAAPVITGVGSICIGSSTTLSASIVGGTWSSMVGRASIDAGGVATGFNAGTAIIRYTITNSSNCSAFGSHNLVVNSVPNIPTIGYATGTTNPQAGAVPSTSFCQNRTFTLIGNPTGGNWSSTNSSVVTVNIGGIANTVGTGIGSVVYTITVNGCSSGKSVVGNVVACVARGVVDNGQLIMDNGFAFYPNPARSIISLYLKTLVGAGSIVVTDLYGKQVKLQALSMGANTVDVSNLLKGIYFVSVITSEGKNTKKLVLE